MVMIFFVLFIVLVLRPRDHTYHVVSVRVVHDQREGVEPGIIPIPRSGPGAFRRTEVAASSVPLAPIPARSFFVARVCVARVR